MNYVVKKNIVEDTLALIKDGSVVDFLRIKEVFDSVRILDGELIYLGESVYSIGGIDYDAYGFQIFYTQSENLHYYRRDILYIEKNRLFPLKRDSEYINVKSGKVISYVYRRISAN